MSVKLYIGNLEIDSSLDFDEGEDFVFAAGGEGADGFAGGVGGAFFVTVF